VAASGAGFSSFPCCLVVVEYMWLHMYSMCRLPIGGPHPIMIDHHHVI
jgi:hypothetical protein